MTPTRLTILSPALAAGAAADSMQTAAEAVDQGYRPYPGKYPNLPKGALDKAPFAVRLRASAPCALEPAGNVHQLCWLG